VRLRRKGWVSIAIGAMTKGGRPAKQETLLVSQYHYISTFNLTSLDNLVHIIRDKAISREACFEYLSNEHGFSLLGSSRWTAQDLSIDCWTPCTLWKASRSSCCSYRRRYGAKTAAMGKEPLKR
jgi:hypothetical protein